MGIETANDLELHERVKREKAAFECESVFEEMDRLQRMFSHVFKTPNVDRARRLHAEKCERFVNNAVVLDYGCLNGWMVPKYRSMGAKKISGIDISTTAIEQAKNSFGDFATFFAADAHEMPFEDDCFDIVVGEAILHHLDIPIALREIRRVLKPGGKALFVEPLGDNPASKFFRALTPRARTVDERPLSGKDINLANRTFGDSDHLYSNLFSTPIAMITSFTRLRPDNIFLKGADAADRVFASTSMRTWMQTAYLCWTKH